jgi:hypothetical protein
LVLDQQRMPGEGNVPQRFKRFDVDLPFFGSTVHDANWFAAEGIPILPIDDAGNENAYPLMRVDAVIKDAEPTDPNNVLASVDVVLPVASEADCQLCHAVSTDLPDDVFQAGAATDMRTNPSPVFEIEHAATAPGDTALNQLQNAAKINILRLHDAKHGASYESWDNTGDVAMLAPTPCDAATNAKIESTIRVVDTPST